MSSRARRRLAVVSGAVWVWSWATMYREVYVWKHVTTSLRFNAPPPAPGRPPPKPGGPLTFLFACFFAAPPVFVAALFWPRGRVPTFDPFPGSPGGGTIDGRPEVRS